MNIQIKYTLQAIFLLSLSAISAVAQMPALRGAEATGHLIKAGHYENLKTAIDNVRGRGDDRTDNSRNFGYPPTTIGYSQFTKSFADTKTVEKNFSESLPSQNTDLTNGFFSETAKLFAHTPSINAEFGGAVAVEGDMAVVGAPRHSFGINDSFFEGAAYVFRRINGVWTFIQRLSAPQPGRSNHFGTGVAISGDTIVVGSDSDGATATAGGKGAAYVFVRSGDSWVLQQRLTASDGEVSDFFGKSVALIGDTAIIGAHGDDTGSALSHGSIYVFTRSGNVWTERQKLIPPGPLASGFALGNDLAVSGDTIVAGMHGDRVSGRSGSGSALVFVKSGETWSQQQKITPDISRQSAAFGWSVAIDGDRIVIGAINESVDGAIYVFSRVAGEWTQEIKLLSPRQTSSQQFGYDVAIKGDTIAASDKTDTNSRGLVYVFSRAGTNWTERQRFSGSDSSNGDQFGHSLSMTGNTLLVGAIHGDIPDVNNIGTAYVFNRSAARRAPFDFDGDGRTDVGIFRPAPGEWWINYSGSNQTFAVQFGSSTDRIAAGDYTGDGKADVAFFRPSDSFWYILRSEDNTFYAFPFGSNGDIHVPADYDGDGKTDAAVFRESNLTWYIQKSSGGLDFVGFGAAGDKPVVADYDGDGKGDIAITRMNGANREWWIRRSSDGQTFAVAFGEANDKPVQGDYTGDGKTDIAFWRPANGFWYILRSEDNSFYAFPFGSNGDTPTPGDYDGDGRFDAAVFRSSNSVWYQQRTTEGFAAIPFGASSDVPVSSANAQ